MSTRKITSSISTPSLSSYDLISNFRQNSFSENNTLKNRSSLKMDTISLKYYTATQKSNRNKLFEIINSKDLRTAFYDFLGTQFCVENLLCWEAIQKFKKLNGTPSEMYSMAEEIYSLFIRDNSRYEINIYGKQKERLKETLKHTFIIPEFSDNNSPTSENEIINSGNGSLTQSISTLNLNTTSGSSFCSNSSIGSGSSNISSSSSSSNNNNIVQSSTFITNAPIQSDTFPKRKRKLRFRKLISKSNLSNIFSDPLNKSASLSNIHSHTTTTSINSQQQQEIIHPPLSPSNTVNFDPEFKNIINNSNNNNNLNSSGANCMVGSCSDNDSFVVIFGNTIGNRKSGSAYAAALSGSDSSDGESSYEDFDRSNIKFGNAKCSNLFNDIQDELEQMMIENSLSEFLKSKLYKDRLNSIALSASQQTQEQQCSSSPTNHSKSNNTDNLNIVN